LLEQQRRLEQQRAQPPAAPGNALTEGATAPPGPAAPGDTRFTIRQFSLHGNTLVPSDVLQRALNPWRGRPVTLAELRQAALALEQMYRDQGWLAQVTLPAQDVTEGELRMEVAEARFGEVRIAAPSAPGGEVTPRLARRVQGVIDAHVSSGQPLNLDALEHALLLANDVPGVRVSGSLQAASMPGSTDVLLQVSRTPVSHGYAGFDNSANRATGAERVSAGVTLDSPWGLGEQLGLAVSRTDASDYEHAAASLPVGAQGWRVGADASALRYRVLNAYNTTTGLAPTGETHTVGLDAQYPLVRSALAHWNATVGVEEKTLRNEDDDVTEGVLQTTNRSHSQALNLSLDGYHFDHLGLGGQSQASVQLSAGQLSLAGSPGAQVQADAETLRTAGSYQTLRWSASRLQALTPTLSLSAAVSGQFASKNLDSAEKFYLGGLGAVNAYPSGEAGGSSGQMVNLELRRQIGAHWQLSGLYDWGRIRKYEDDSRAGGGLLDPHNAVTLQGFGASLAWRADNGGQVKMVFARRIGSNPLATPTGTDTDGSLHENRLWVTANVAF
jgi:hemolysin activation/secretion protein